MSLKHPNTNKIRPLEAWKSVGADEGVKTRRRSARLNTTLSQSPSQSSAEVSFTKENDGRSDHVDISEEGGISRAVLTDKGNYKKAPGGIAVTTRKPPVKLNPQNRRIEPAVTTRARDLSYLNTTINTLQGSSESTADNKFKMNEDGERLQIGSLTPRDQNTNSSDDAPKHTVGLLHQELWDKPAVLGSGFSKRVSPSSTEPHSPTINNTVALCEESFDSDMEEDSSSEATAMPQQQEIDELKAANEDLRSENQYYRLMSEITMKTAALRRGCTRSPIIPTSLSPQLCNLHHKLMTEGLKIPDLASDRARVVADVIELHLTWEFENLKHSISSSAAVNAFVDFAALFLPQIRSLALGEYVGGEETYEARAEISAIVLKLVVWIVEESAILAECVAPKYLPSQSSEWYDEGVRALWDLDTCLERAFQHRMHSFPEALILGSFTEAPGLYSDGILEWAFLQLTWANKVAGRLQRTVDMVPNQYGVKVELFLLTRQSLKNFIRHGQRQIEVARQLREAEFARANAVEAEGQGWGL